MMNKYVSSIDANKREFLKSCKAIQDSDNIKYCKEIAFEILKNSSFDYNFITTIYTVFVNKLINIYVKEIEYFIGETNESIEDFSLRTKKIVENVSSIAEEIIEMSSFNCEFKSYLKLLLQCITSAFVYSDSVKSGYSYDMWEREEYIYDRMHLLAKEDFTIENRIEIPYMYIFIWALDSYSSRRVVKTEGLSNCERNVKVCFTRLGNVMREVAISGETMKDGIFMIGSKRAREELIRKNEHYLEVNFENLLPSIRYANSCIKVKDDKDRKKLLAMNPMIPYFETTFTKDVLVLVSDSVVKSIELEKINKKLDKAITEKNSIIQDFTHTYKNMRATGLYDMAKMLLDSKDEKMKSLGRKTLYEYSIKETLTKEVYLLSLKFEQNSQALKQTLLQGKADIGDTDIDTIQDIFNESLKMCFVRVFYDLKDKDGEFIYNQLETMIDNINYAMDYFEENVVAGEEKTIDWLNKSLLNMDFKFDEKWATMRLKKADYSATFLRSIITELIINALKYADKEKPIVFSLISPSSSKLAIVVENHISGKKFRSSKKGLTSKNEILKLISNEKDDAIKTDERDGVFTTKVELPAELFI